MNDHDKTNSEAQAKVWKMIKDIRVCLMVTQNQQGKLSSRPMSAVEQEKFDGKLWFFTNKAAPMTQEINQKAHVLLSYSEPKDQNYVSINGTACLVDDRKKIDELWTDYLRTWFPKGKEDPDIALICVDVEEAEYWDAPSGTFVYLYGYAKAALTGEPPKDIGEKKKVSF